MDILTAVLLVGVIALIAGLGLAIASVALAVPKDELTEKLRECLPGANCGACGYSGCDGYAAAMAHEGAPVGRCTPGGAQTLADTSAILGVEGELVHSVATVRCGGCDAVSPRTHIYDGIQSCRAAAQLYGGDKGCTFGCLGYGDCVSVCEYGGIRIEDGIAHIDAAKCHGCNQCVTTCPRGVIALLPEPKAVVRCHSTAKGAAQRKVCTAGCIGCMKCTKVCEHDAIHVENNLASIDPEKCTGCGKCAEGCPVHCIDLLH